MYYITLCHVLLHHSILYCSICIVSVQVCTFARPSLLRHALRTIAAQAYPMDLVEVLVVDDSPECGWAAVRCASCGAEWPFALTYFRGSHLSNAGVLQTRRTIPQATMVLDTINSAYNKRGRSRQAALDKQRHPGTGGSTGGCPSAASGTGPARTPAALGFFKDAV